jgi:hypothetical protein
MGTLLRHGLALAAISVTACASSHRESELPAIDAGDARDELADSSAPLIDAAFEDEPAVAIVPLAFVPDSPLVYQSTTDISLPDAEQGQGYVQTIQVRKGTGVAPYHLSVSGPDAHDLVAIVDRNDSADATVLIVGTPTDLGTSLLHVDVVDAAGAKLTSTFVVRVLEARASIVRAMVPPARAGVPGYTATFLAMGGIPPLVWSATGLPAGMSIDPDTGSLGGVPDAVSGDHDVTFTLTVTDSIPDASSHAPTPRSASIQMPMHVDPGYRVNIYKLLVDSACNFCHGDVGNDRYYKPRIAGIPTPPAGMENATGLIGQHPGGTAGDAHETVCLPTMTYVVPGDPEGSLFFQKISGTLDHPPPCGSCMPYQGSCNTAPTLSAGALDLVRHWILSLPPMPTEKDLE